MKFKEFEKPEYFVNRELSWIGFNYRILSEARDKANPLFERLKFLSITSSNLDEFFMVRVASLKDMVNAGYKEPDIAGMTPKEQLSAISEALHEFTQTQYSTYNRSLLPLLAKEHITVLTSFEQMNDEEASFADNFFMEKVYPVLTPMAVDASRPFPIIRNKSLNIAALIKTKNQSEEEMEPELEFATVQVPSVMGRIVQLPCTEGVKLILLEEIIRRNISKLFLNYDVISTAAYRIERNADLSIDEEEAEDLLQEIEKQLKQRQWGEAIKLEVSEEIDKYLLKYLKKELAISDEEIYKIQGPLDLTFLMKLYGMEGFDAFKQPKYKPQRCPQIAPELSIFDNIKKGDIFLHHPYITFDPVVNFIKEAAVDPKVLAIKQTLYRVSGNSPIVAALAKAAENGKQVSVLVELKARFDEENNIEWSRQLEDAGCRVIYGLDGYKVHSKLCLITRKKKGKVSYITQIGTGNYNEKTSRLYTDLSLMTANVDIALEAAEVFQALSMGETVEETDHLLVAPHCLQNKVLHMIDREIEHAKAGETAYIGLKMNSLTDKKIMEKLIKASKAGVKIDMVIRGICCLIPGVKGETDNIQVRSIVGRYLEHSRIYIFGCGERKKIYIASADFMTRNTVHRVEVATPIYDPEIAQRLEEMFITMLSDNQKAREEDEEGNYHLIYRQEDTPLNSQKFFYESAYNNALQ